MNYEICWNLLRHRIEEHERKAKNNPQGWVTLLTTQVILEMMSDIEKEVEISKLKNEIEELKGGTLNDQQRESKTDN